MLFPKTSEAPASPPAPSPIRRATDRQLRQILTAEAEVLRRMELDRESRDNVQSEVQSRIRFGDSHSSRRRRRTSSAIQGLLSHSSFAAECNHGDVTVESHGVDSVPSVTSWRGVSVSPSLNRAHLPAGSVGGSLSRPSMGTEAYPASRSRHHHHHHHHHDSIELQPSPIDHHRSALLSSTSLNASTSSNRNSTTNETRTHREDNRLPEMLSSSEYLSMETMNGQRRPVSRIRNGHGPGIANALNRSASHGDLQNDVEYVTVQRVQRVDQAPSNRHRGVYGFGDYHRDRFLQQYRPNRGQQPPSTVEDAPAEQRSAELMEGTYFDEDDFATASDIVSDRDSSFTSSTAAPYLGSRVNSFRFHEETPSSPVSTAADTHNESSGSAVASFAGFERLYDISSQIEAAMNDIERLSLQPGWSRRTENTQPPVTPLTHRSCFQLSDEEEDDDVDWNARIRDAVFIVDDLETETETESDEDEETSLPVSPFHEMDGALNHMTESQWISSVEDSYSYY